MMKNFTTLGIDTSCDETSASVVEGTTVLSNVLPSQMEFHKKYGGVVPSLARLAHEERIDGVVVEALKKAGKTIQDIDMIAVTQGPGLAIALEIGVKKAKSLAAEFHKPLIVMNHMEGHLLSAFAERNPKSELLISKQNTNSKPQNPSKSLFEKEFRDVFPALGFLISGGHTELILVKAIGEYEKIGETQDDSCGEAYDKCGRILGLGYPAGPVISKFARENRKNFTITVKRDNKSTIVVSKNKLTGKEYPLPVPMAYSGNYNFSYSGLKTAFKKLVEELSGKSLTHEDEINGEHHLSKEDILALCVAFEAAAITQLQIKLRKALKEIRDQRTKSGIKEVWLGGGVVASARLRSELRKTAREFGAETRYPFGKKLTGDNAAMIAVAANLRVGKLESGKVVEHNPQLGIYTKDFDLIDRDPSLSL